ncbi:MAG TPA: transporter [Steroidobacteraceae bacterium]|nr:transporter [Steroidobacteraceae bacterium]
MRSRALRWLTLLALLAAAAAHAEDLQSREDAWWTGPLLAPSPVTLPPGHALIEPYLFDVVTTGRIDSSGTHQTAPADQEFGSLTYMLYGLTPRVTAGLIPRFFYADPAGAPNSSGIAVGDLTLQAAFGLTQYRDGSRVPALAVVLDETLPTGKYDRLTRASDGVGAGAYATGLSLYSQDYFWMPNGRILRARLDLTYTISSKVPVQEQSVYGTPGGFAGHAYPGEVFSADAAFEYSMTRSWVLAMDVVYEHHATTEVRGTVSGGSALHADSGSAYSVQFAPAVEYNWSARAGVILGVRIIEVGRNVTTTVTPAVAINLVL